MPNPIVIAYHLVWTAYGWWLPNDVRGSTSKFIASDVLAEIAELHYGRKRLQPLRKELLKFFETAHARLKHAAVEFTAAEITATGTAFGEAILALKYTCYACAI